MKLTLPISMTLLAASVAAPCVFAQAAAPRARVATNTIAAMSSPYLGIGVQDIDPDRAKALKLKDVRGAEITRVVDESPAAKAGLKDGDVVLEYNGQPVEGKDQLARMISETPAGRQVKVGVWRNGAAQTILATIEEQKGPSGFFPGDAAGMLKGVEPWGAFSMPKLQTFSMSPMIGIYGESLGSQEQLAEFFGVKEGVLVRSVTRNSAADKAGLKAGDVIVKVDDSTVSTTSDITSALRASRTLKSITLTVVRNKKEMPLTVTIESSLPPTRAAVVAPAGRIYVASRSGQRPIVLQLSPDHGII